MPLRHDPMASISVATDFSTVLRSDSTALRLTFLFPLPFPARSKLILGHFCSLAKLQADSGSTLLSTEVVKTHSQNIKPIPICSDGEFGEPTSIDRRR